MVEIVGHGKLKSPARFGEINAHLHPSDQSDALEGQHRRFARETFGTIEKHMTPERERRERENNKLTRPKS